MQGKILYKKERPEAVALVVDPKQADKTVSICSQAGYSTFVAGYVENGPKQVKILPAKITFEDDSMKLR